MLKVVNRFERPSCFKENLGVTVADWCIYWVHVCTVVEIQQYSSTAVQQGGVNDMAQTRTRVVSKYTAGSLWGTRSIRGQNDFGYLREWRTTYVHVANI